MTEPTPRSEDRRPDGPRGGRERRRSADGTTGPRSVRRSDRRRPEGRLGELVSRARALWSGLLDKPVVWLAVFLLVGAWALTPGGLFFTPLIEADSIAQRDYVAPEELLVPDQEATIEKQRRARDEILPVYDFDRATIDARDAALARLFATGRRMVGSDPQALRSAPRWRENLAARLEEASELEISPAQAGALADWAFAPDLEDRARSVVRQALRRGVVAAKEALLENRMRGITLRDLEAGTERQHFDLFDHLGYPDELREFLDAEVRDWLGLSAGERREMVELLVSAIPPNLHPNRSETLSRREAAAAAVTPAFNRISEGEVIVRKGDRVDAGTAELISEIGGEKGWSGRAVPFGGTFLLLVLAAVALWLALSRERVAGHSRQRLYSESLLLVLLALLGTKLSFLVAHGLASSFEAAPFNSEQSYVFGVPFAALGLVSALLLGRGPAVLLSLVFSVLVARLGGPDGSVVILYSLAGSLAAGFAVERMRATQRMVMTRIGLLVGLVNLAMVVNLLALTGGLDRGPAQVAFDLLCAFAGGLLVGAAAGFAVPVLESLLGLTTDIKLVELANTNLPLLRRVAFEAPGTFQHSLMVANLAKEGCEAIGADATLAYTGGLYHDIGKVFRPEYFIENQRPGHNRHDKLTPSMSALILINHIKEGVDLALKHHLPQPLIDAIEQHHGTRLIKYFYNRALERADPDTEEVREEKYRYPGPKPQNKVMGVLMIADGVEAASRTLVEPTPLKIRTLIRTILDDCLRDGQLDQTDLTLRDLRRVSDAFLRVLTTIFHQRIDYPGFDFNAEPKRVRAADETASAVTAPRAVS